MTFSSILPPGSTQLEKSLEQVAAAILDMPVPVRSVWSPESCPVELLPWLAWGVSVDVWDADWPEAVKRSAIASSIASHRHKGTRASLRTILDRVDPLIRIVEWFEDRETLDPYCFRLELPLSADSDVIYDDDLVGLIIRDISQAKPVRAHLTAVFRLKAQAQAWLLSAAAVAGQSRQTAAADTAPALDPIWNSYLQSEDGEPLLDEAEQFLEE